MDKIKIRHSFLMAGPSNTRLQELELDSTAELCDIPLTGNESFLLQRVDESTIDRRVSKEIGGEARLSETFGRLRNKHESVDWSFWGAVVQDYERVARTQPAELAAAIQKGIPDVIRQVRKEIPLITGALYGSSCHRASRRR